MRTAHSSRAARLVWLLLPELAIGLAARPKLTSAREGGSLAPLGAEETRGIAEPSPFGLAACPLQRAGERRTSRPAAATPVATSEMRRGPAADGDEVDERSA